MPLRPLTILTTLLHLYIGLRLVGALSAWPGAGPALAVALLLSAIALPMPFQHRSGRRGAAHPAWTWLGLLAMGWFSSLFLLTLLRDLVLAGAWAGGWLQEGGSARADSAAAVVVLATLASLLGFWNARRTAGVRRVDVALAGLPAALHGFTIVQLSDLHVGPTIRRGYIARIVSRVNELQADAIAITGDLVDGSVAELREHIAPLADPGPVHTVFGDRVARPGGWMQGTRVQQGWSLASAGNAADGPQAGQPEGKVLADAPLVVALLACARAHAASRA